MYTCGFLTRSLTSSPRACYRPLSLHPPHSSSLPSALPQPELGPILKVPSVVFEDSNRNPMNGQDLLGAMLGGMARRTGTYVTLPVNIAKLKAMTAFDSSGFIVRARGVGADVKTSDQERNAADDAGRPRS